jgi:polygalacturonase
MWTARREFLKAGAGFAALGVARPVFAAGPQAQAWAEVPKILQRIKAPSFPKRDFDITRYGAAGDGVKDSTGAIARAIAECSRAGGGHVIVPRGVFATAAIHLKSNVDLHVSAGATLLFLRDSTRYLPLVQTRFEGTECMNYSAFIYADGQENTPLPTIGGSGPAAAEPTFSPSARPVGVCSIWARATFRSPSGSLAKAASCGRTLSSPSGRATF